MQHDAVAQDYILSYSESSEQVFMVKLGKTESYNLSQTDKKNPQLH